MRALEARWRSVRVCASVVVVVLGLWGELRETFWALPGQFRFVIDTRLTRSCTSTFERTCILIIGIYNAKILLINRSYW